MTAEVPQEIIERILHELALDHSSLKTCSLLNSEWRPHSQALLFRRLHIRVGPRNLDGSPGMLLKDSQTSREFYQHVKTLLINCYTPNASDLDPLLDLGIGRIKYLHMHLSLQLIDEPIKRMFKKFGTVTYLYLNRFRVTSIVDISNLLSGLPDLESLTLKGWSGSPEYKDGSAESNLTAPLSQLHTLNLDWFGVRGVPHVLSWVTDNLESFPRLATVRMFDVTTLDKLSAFLRKLGPSLRNLELALATAEDGVFSNGIRLEDNPCLESVSVQTGDNIVQFAELVASLRHHKKLEELILTTRRVSDSTLSHASWRPVDERLSSPLFKPKLKQLVIRATHVPLDDSAMKSALPRFSATGLILPIGNYIERYQIWKGDLSMRKMWGDSECVEFLDDDERGDSFKDSKLW